MQRRFYGISNVAACALLLAAGWPDGRSVGHAQESSSVSKAQQTLQDAAQQRQYTFLVFYRDNTPGLQAMGQTVKQMVAQRPSQATMAYVSVANPADQPLVQKLGVSRSPLPLTIALAPNGAIMGVFSQKVSEAQLADSFGTPVMTHIMKAMQEQKLALVCVQETAGTPLPTGVQDFQRDAEFAGRTQVIAISMLNTAEADFLRQMQIDPVRHRGTTTVFFAPPSVMIGKFDQTASKAQMVAALHKAGKCCDDPNCKHGAASAAPPPSPPPSASRRTTLMR